jgi:hypothetical protein
VKLQAVDDLVDHLALGAHGQPDRSFRGASKTRTSDVQLHIGESRSNYFEIPGSPLRGTPE